MFIALFIDDTQVMEILTKVLNRIVTEGVTTETLCERLAPVLRLFLKLVPFESTEEQAGKFSKYAECLTAVQ